MAIATMARPRTKKCRRLKCQRPSRASGLCRMHYQREYRALGGRLFTADGGGVPMSQDVKNGASDQDFVNTFSQLTDIEVDGQKHQVRYSDEGQAYIFLGGVFRALDEEGNPTDAFQLPGVVCKDCHHHWAQACVRPSCKPVCVRKRDIGWCDGDRHYVFLGKPSA